MMDERNGKKNYVPNVFWGKYLNQVLSYEEEIRTYLSRSYSPTFIYSNFL